MFGQASTAGHYLQLLLLLLQLLLLLLLVVVESSVVTLDGGLGLEDVQRALFCSSRFSISRSFMEQEWRATDNQRQ